MAVKKATVESTMAKVEATPKAEEKKAAAPKTAAKKETAVKTEEKKAAAPKAAAKTEEKKAAAPKAAAKTEEKKAAAPKAAAKTEEKKAAAPKKTATTQKVVIEYAGGQVVTSDIVAKAVEVSGKKSIKELNVYYQPETNMVYFTADGEEGSFSL